MAAVVAAALPASASADYVVTYNGTSDTVIISAGSTSPVQAEYGYSFCLFPPCPAKPLIVSSSNSTSMTESAGAQCDPGSSSDSVNCFTSARVRLNGTSAADTFEGFCLFGSAQPEFVGMDGADDVTVLFCPGGNVDLGPGNDSSSGAQIVNGGDGNDVITGAGAADSLDGGNGRDTVSGGAGNDTVQGGEGRDLLVPGADQDTILGGNGIDAASYEDHSGVTVSLNGAADDGAAGEGDNLGNDVENLIGSPGDDTLNGNAGRNDLEGAEGGDVIDPGGGNDLVDAGAGNDRVLARDGAIDAVECGADNDQAVIDEFDTATNCEDVQSSRDLMPDVDNDGVPAPADCNDRNPRVRPGIPDKPRNGIDDDCRGGDARYRRIVSGVQAEFSASGTTTVRTLKVIDVPAGGRTELRCRGGRRKGCFNGVKRRRFRRGAGEVNLRGAFKGRRLAPGAVIDVRILAPDSIGKVVRYRVRRNAAPKTSLLCLVPGQNAPGRCR